MSDILMSVETRTVYCIGVKPYGWDTVQFMHNEDDHLTALKFVNKMNCTKGLATGDLYVIEEMEVTV